MLQVKWFTVLYADNNVLYFNEGSDDFIFCCNRMGIISIDLNNINLDDSNYDDNDPETIIQIRPSAWHTKFEKHEALKRVKRRINASSVIS